MRHPGDIELTWAEARDALAALEQSLVTVRVVERGEPEMLVAVLAGRLGAMSRSKHPALYWPVETPGAAHPEALEEGGFYLRHDRFDGAFARAGGSIVLVCQGQVLINVRQAIHALAS
jgi:hypothetical protein